MIFDQTFVVSPKNTKEPLAFALSLLIETCAVAFLVLIPLIYSQKLPGVHLKNLLRVAPPAASPPKAPIEVKTQHVLVVRHLPALIAPRVVPKQINTSVQQIQAAPDVLIAGASNGIGDPAPDGIIGDVLVAVPKPAPAIAKPQPPSGPLRIATGIAEANLIHKVMPAYPALAKSARVQGTVEFTAMISKQGTIENLRLVRGHPLLVQAAQDAVLRWRYRPTLLNGQAVEVMTDIIVNFTLSQ